MCAPPAAATSEPRDEVRSLDGSRNNIGHPTWGMAGKPYARVAKPGYADGIGAIARGPSPRYISNRVFDDRSQNLFSETGVTQLGFAWSQFLDHTFGLKEDPRGERAPMPFNARDALESFTHDFDAMSFERTPAASGTGTGASSPRQQNNVVSSYMDGWNVYGGSPQRLDWMREGPVDGNPANNRARLLLTADGHLPRRDARGDAARAPVMELMGRLRATPARAIVAGDVRANENAALTSLQTLFAREHNRIVGQLPKQLSEESRFQIARRVVAAEQQYITYTEFLPALGVWLPPYRGYDPNLDATLSNEFAAVGFRAHSMIHGEFEPMAPAGRHTPQQLEALRAKHVEVTPVGDEVEFVVPLNVSFGDPELVQQIGLGPILAGLAAERQYRNDEQIDNQLRSVLFSVPRSNIDPSACLDGPTLPQCFQGVVDLAAIDIQRGRDHGIPPYNELRRGYGLAPKSSFAAITGERTDAFGRDPLVNAADPINDPEILDFVELRGARGELLQIGSEEADAGAITGVRRTPLAARLKAVYGGDIRRVDAFVGMVSEPHVRGTEFGELQLAIWKREFARLRDGDRFFYLNDRGLNEIATRYGISYQRRLSDIVALNTELDPGDLQDAVFKVVE